jgi:hypothetical protein
MAHPLAGKPAPKELLVDVPDLLRRYAAESPDPSHPAERVAFGTSGHRGSALRRSFNEAHLLAVAQAVAEHRARAGVTGPLFLGRDTHALSEPAERSALEVLAANGVEVVISQGGAPVPTPVISHAILGHNRGRAARLADGIDRTHERAAHRMEDRVGRGRSRQCHRERERNRRRACNPSHHRANGTRSTLSARYHSGVLRWWPAGARMTGAYRCHEQISWRRGRGGRTVAACRPATARAACSSRS